MQTWRTVFILAATLTSGLLAGLYYAYAISVMPALNQLDSRSAIHAMQRINVVIVNPMFMLTFLGAPLLAAAALFTVFGRDARPVLWWIVAAVVLNIVGTLITAGFNVPLNNRLDQNSIAWTDFFGSWVRWNWARAVCHTAAFGCLAWSLVVLRGK
ncbi:anthrone oxygenase family protein [Jongsikchunia kroppenstedtii]|uniref:anthrone oxygenase family protein n=1 Tax=Jongsikchunia kroppenstedtii TaxID=1121721 RepID=UPI0003765407|nr:anthrone oxygenase family protein [Jongsikchunia kroppenstedtii]